MRLPWLLRLQMVRRQDKRELTPFQGYWRVVEEILTDDGHVGHPSIRYPDAPGDGSGKRIKKG